MSERVSGALRTAQINDLFQHFCDQSGFKRLVFPPKPTESQNVCTILISMVHCMFHFSVSVAVSVWVCVCKCVYVFDDMP